MQTLAERVAAVSHRMNTDGRGFRVPLPMSKKYFYPLDPRPEDFHVEDIAHKLAMQCRYGGGTIDFYSVAEHCVHVSRSPRVPPDMRLAALLHDRAEAYLQDISRPVKMMCQPWYGEIEDNIERVSAPVFGVPYPNPPEVMHADYCICIDEKLQAYTCGFESENVLEDDLSNALGVQVQFWTPQEAKRQFLARYVELQNGNF